MNETRPNALRLLLRFVQGMLIGVGAVLPGISGGVLCPFAGYCRILLRFRDLYHCSGVFRDNWFLSKIIGGFLRGRQGKIWLYLFGKSGKRLEFYTKFCAQLDAGRR